MVMEWQSIATAPFELELAVINDDGTHALVFPCRRILGSWMNAETKERIDCAQPTGESGPGLGPRLLLTGRVVQRRQFGLFVRQQALQRLALGLIGFVSQNSCESA